MSAISLQFQEATNIANQLSADYSINTFISAETRNFIGNQLSNESVSSVEELAMRVSEFDLTDSAGLKLDQSKFRTLIMTLIRIGGQGS